jgi:hypothetical protein
MNVVPLPTLQAVYPAVANLSYSHLLHNWLKQRLVTNVEHEKLKALSMEYGVHNSQLFCRLERPKCYDQPFLQTLPRPARKCPVKQALLKLARRTV